MLTINKKYFPVISDFRQIKWKAVLRFGQEPRHYGSQELIQVILIDLTELRGEGCGGRKQRAEE